MMKTPENTLFYGLFYHSMRFVFFKGDYMILSKIIIFISLLAKNLMVNFTCMNNKNLKLNLGLGQPSFLSFCYAPDQDSKLIKKNERSF